MSLANIRDTIGTVRSHLPCDVERALHTLDSEDQVHLTRDLYDHTLQAVPLSTAWAQHDIHISDQTIRRHRNRRCGRCRDLQRYPA